MSGGDNPKPMYHLWQAAEIDQLVKDLGLGKTVDKDEEAKRS